MKMTIPLLLILAILAMTNAHMRVCYYSNWSQYRNGAAKFFPEDIDPHLCTHLIYSFANLTNNQLATWEWNDVDLYARFNGLKAINPDLKTLLAVGGWTAGSASFSTMVSSSTLRKNFASTSAAFLRTFGFDGLDLDWEYPALRGGAPSDKQNFILLLKDLKKEFKREQESSGLPRLLLTAAVAAGKSNIDAAYDIPEMNRYLDFINLMAYDLHGGWESSTGHNAPLTENDPEKTLNVDWAARYWRDNGAAPNKLIIGLATYGRSFQLANANNHGMGAPAVGSGGVAGPYTGTVGFLAYYEVCLKLSRNEGTRMWNSEMKVPYLVDGNQWIGYDDEESIIEKLQYIKNNNYGGAMVWTLDLDDFSQMCPLSNRSYPLISLMKTVLGAPPTSPPTTQPPASTNGPTNPSTNEPSNPSTQGPTNPSTQGPTNPSTKGPTGPPNKEFCSSRADGLYSDPRDCNSFYECSNRVTYPMRCPQNLVFNPNQDYCDHAYNYDCKVTAGTTAQPQTTQEPTTQAPTTDAPTTEAPTPKTPTTEAPTTEAPTTEARTTEAPTTKAPTTQQPTTQAPGQPDPNFCDDVADGLYRMIEDCSKYYQCAHRITRVGSCPPGTLYNAPAKICDWPASVDCSETATQTDYCNGMPDGLYWYPYDCSKYYKCGSGITYILSCPAGNLFDSSVSNCGWRGEVDCKGAPDK